MLSLKCFYLNEGREFCYKLFIKVLKGCPENCKFFKKRICEGCESSCKKKKACEGFKRKKGWAHEEQMFEV